MWCKKRASFFSTTVLYEEPFIRYVTIYRFELFLLSVETLTSPSAVHSVSNRSCYPHGTERIDLVFCGYRETLKADTSLCT